MATQIKAYLLRPDRLTAMYVRRQPEVFWCKRKLLLLLAFLKPRPAAIKRCSLSHLHEWRARINQYECVIYGDWSTTCSLDWSIWQWQFWNDLLTRIVMAVSRRFTFHRSSCRYWLVIWGAFTHNSSRNRRRTSKFFEKLLRWVPLTSLIRTSSVRCVLRWKVSFIYCSSNSWS